MFNKLAIFKVSKIIVENRNILNIFKKFLISEHSSFDKKQFKLFSEFAIFIIIDNKKGYNGSRKFVGDFKTAFSSISRLKVLLFAML